LTLKNNSLGEKEIIPLIETPNFPFLEALDLYNNLNVTKNLAKKVVESPHFPYLEGVVYGNGETYMKHK